MGKKSPNTNIPWTDVLNKTVLYTVYRDYYEDDGDTKKIKRYIFVPIESNALGIMTSVVNAYQLGLSQNKIDGWNGFQVVVKVETDNQEIDIPYIELLPEWKINE
jgi:hypothetical protein